MTLNEHGTTTNLLSQVLLALEGLQEREAAVLRSMNAAELDVITSEKEALCETLRELLTRKPIDAQHRSSLERLRHSASLNQLLVVHARDTVRTILSQASGAPVEALPGARKVVIQDGLRVNLRG